MNSTVKSVAVVAAIFLAGVVTGSVNTIGVGRRLAEHRLSIDRFHSTLMGILKSELALSAGQEAKVEPMVRQACEQYRQLVLETVQRVSDLVQATNARLAHELTPAQAERLLQLEAERQRQVREKLDHQFLERDFLGEP